MHKPRPIKAGHAKPIGVAGAAAAALGIEHERHPPLLDQAEHAVDLLVVHVALGASQHGVVVCDHHAAGRFGTELRGIHRGSPRDQTVGRSIPDQVLQLAAPPLRRDRERAVLNERTLIDELGNVFAGRALVGVAPPLNRIRAVLVKRVRMSCDHFRKIATKNASIGMGGPAMIEGGGLGVYHPAEVGPVSFQASNGVIDILVDDEEQATRVAQKYLSYFQGATADWKAADQRLLRRAIPENRLRVYDIRNVIEILADEGSVLEIRRDFGIGMITAFIRIEGKPFGLIANNPKHLGGAIDAPAGDKAARFMQLCDAFDIPIVSLCDTPGFMVGPEAEKTAIVRHVSRMFVTGASLTVPLFALVLRKGYGLGAQSMIGGGFHASFFTVSWPTGEFGGMGLEGYVRLGFRKEMEAIADPVERENYYKAKVAELYSNGKATSIASVFEIDEVIDPADTRHWIMAGLRSVPPPGPRHGRKRPCIDAW